MKTNNILVVAAHPDDEVLGVAGTLCKHRDAGDDISILILADGETSREEGVDVKKRLLQAEEVSKRFGAKLYLERLPDNAFDTVSLLSIAKFVEKVVEKESPNIIYTHNPTDLNIDHRLACQATMTACRPQPGHCVKNIYAFETLSSTEWQIKDYRQFQPHHYNDITSSLEEKLDIMSIYKDELRVFSHPRSLKGIEVLAQYRGMEVGVNSAEAFQVIRSIVK